MGHVQDLWMKRGPDGKKNVRTARYGRGKRWQARWTDPAGNEPTRTFRTYDAALAHVAAMDVEVHSGSYIDPVRGQVQFRPYAERWLANQLHLRDSSLEAIERRFRLHVYPVLGEAQMRAIRRKDVQDMITGAKQRLAPSTVAVTYTYVAAVFRSAVLDKDLRESPCVKISLPPDPAKKVVPILADQVATIYDQVPARYRAAVVVAAASGLRQGELFGLTEDRLAGSRDNIELLVDRQRGPRPGTFSDLKTENSDRGVSIGPYASERLWEHIETFGVGKHGHIFTTSRGTEVCRRHAVRIWQYGSSDLVLRDRSGWHDLRHFYVSMLINEGLSITAVAELIGDTVETTSKVYAHMWPNDHERAVRAVDKVVGGLFRNVRPVPDGTQTEQTPDFTLDVPEGLAQGSIGPELSVLPPADGVTCGNVTRLDEPA